MVAISISIVCVDQTYQKACHHNQES